MCEMSHRLNSLIKEKKLTKKYIATKLEVSPDLVSKWCSVNPYNRRDPNTQHLSQLADLLDVTTDYLLCRTKSLDNKYKVEDLDISIINEAVEKYGVSIDDQRYSIEDIRAIIQTFKNINKLNGIL